MAINLGPPEEINIFYKDDGELNPPMRYMPTRIIYQDAGKGVFLITLNDPKRLNCMSACFSQEVCLVIEHAKRDDRCKILVWTGAGRAFCAGGNFTDASTTVPDGVMEGYVKAGLMLPLPDLSAAGSTREMIKLPKLSISAVNGLAVGGGVNMALVWQDLAYASEDVTFRLPFSELGLTPELGSSFMLPHLVGNMRAKELLMLGPTIDAKKAYDIGLLVEVTPKGEVLQRALAAAHQLAGYPQFAQRQAKRLINREILKIVDEATEEEYHTFRNSMKSEETQKAMAALTARTSKQSKL